MHGKESHSFDWIIELLPELDNILLRSLVAGLEIFLVDLRLIDVVVNVEQM